MDISHRFSSSVGVAPSQTSNSNTTTTASTKSSSSSATPSLEALQATHELWELVCGAALVNPRTQQNLLHSTSNVCLAKALLDRAHQLDHYSPQSSHQWLLRMLQQGDGENGYTPLHWAVLKAKLPVLLLFLRYAVANKSCNDATKNNNSSTKNNNNNNSNKTNEAYNPVMSSRTRLLHRPLALLQSDVPNLSDDARAIFGTVDNEGLTAVKLLERLQVKELAKCRKSLVFSPLNGAVMQANGTGRPRQNSFQAAAMLQEDHQAQQQNEFATLHNYMQQEQDRPRSVFEGYQWQNEDSSYACEVLTFGRPNHLALGVQGGKNNHHERTTTVSESSSSSSSPGTTTFRPHRVQTFAQDRVGRAGSAVAIAAAAHHTLVATRQGHLYAFGIGTGGRLGTGKDEKHCPAPTRVLGPLFQRRVVAIAAAENHSLCVTSDGAVYAFGSNRFGQLGYSNNNSGRSSSTAEHNGGESASRCCLPRRVDDLWKKHVLCISVAAGEKHSVALSQNGEVYVWGCNASGQLGINNRRSTSNSQMAPHRVQRVDALWNGEKRRACFKIAASSQATLVLAKPNTGGLPVNQVYAWGHGNHVPSKVHLSDPNEEDSQRQHAGDKFTTSAAGRRSINPVDIACARHHNAAITSDGRVYTWGFHADPLGGQTAAPSSSKSGTPKTATNNCSRPQLVTGMLPEEGGGYAVAVSASENHTAVVTNDGALFTWGASYGKGVLGHEGVRWQPSPKRVCGVSRAVGVAAAKEHTILLMGATFPSIKSSAPSKIPSLEQLAAHEVAKHIDLFNALPILMTAERTNCRYLVEQCQEFVRLNLDGVLNVGQKSIMDMYLNEQVASGLLLLDEDPRDRLERPLILRIALAARGERKGRLESETILSDSMEWMKSCEKLAKKDTLKQLVDRMRREAAARPAVYANPKLRRRSSSSVGSYSEAFRENGSMPRSAHDLSDAGVERKMSSSERCIILTTNMDLTSRELVEAKHDCLSKEIRGLKKRLNQISKLESLVIEEDDPEKPNPLSTEQQDKVARRPQLESELYFFEPALRRVEKCMSQYNLRPRRLSSGGPNEVEEMQPLEDAKKCLASREQSSTDQKSVETAALESASSMVAASLRCATCNISCPDETSFALHMNGRKHRNRVAQVAEEERKRAAAAILEERLRQQMQAMSTPTQKRQPPSTPSAWSKGNAKPKRAAQPKYKLPPPSNQAQEIVEKNSKSLQEIMAEEAASQRAAIVKVQAPASSFGPLQLPLGSAPVMNSPPWAAKPLVTPKKMAAASASSPWLSASPKATPGNPPPLSSPRWASMPVKAATLSHITASPALTHSQAPRATTSFGAFLLKAPTTPQNARSPSSSAPWSAARPPTNRPGFGSTPLLRKQKASPSTSDGVNFADIQKQEASFKMVQDKSFQDNGKWFIERRERAGSLASIQQAEDKEREEQLMVEEQKRIEEDIQREVALQKKKDDAKKTHQQQQKAKKKKAKNKNKLDSGSKQKQKTPQNKSHQTNGDNVEGGSTPQENQNAHTGGAKPTSKGKHNAKGANSNSRQRRNKNAKNSNSDKSQISANLAAAEAAR